MNLKEIIKNNIIQKKQPIGFDKFMGLALYHHKFGYYRSQAQKIGRYGDFITAPEISDLFGYSIANQCAQILNGENDILEFGAGRGVLAAQVLFALARLDKLPRKYYILELSSVLKNQQYEIISKVLPELIDRVVWLDSMPLTFDGVVIANEVLDAMPAKRFICKDGVFFELGVGYGDGEFIWQAFTDAYKSSDSSLPKNVVDGYTTEVNLQTNAWITSLSKIVNEGLVLIIDYGMENAQYFHSQRTDGTLRCYYQHQASDNPFINIGAQDITVSVNFSAISKQAHSSGFTVSGYATQAMFLISLGIYKHLEQEQDTKQYTTLAQQIKKLVLPGVMGESFKVLALQKGINIALDGFIEQNLIYKL